MESSWGSKGKGRYHERGPPLMQNSEQAYNTKPTLQLYIGAIWLACRDILFFKKILRVLSFLIASLLHRRARIVHSPLREKKVLVQSNCSHVVDFKPNSWKMRNETQLRRNFEEASPVLRTSYINEKSTLIRGSKQR